MISALGDDYHRLSNECKFRDVHRLAWPVSDVVYEGVVLLWCLLVSGAVPLSRVSGRGWWLPSRCHTGVVLAALVS